MFRRLATSAVVQKVAPQSKIFYIWPLEQSKFATKYRFMRNLA
jgi:hypothetical protein